MKIESQRKEEVEKINIRIDRELNDFVVPLAKEEFAQLEQNVLKEGCREPIILWRKEKNHNVIVDGHNRYKICTRHNISFSTSVLLFDGIEEVKSWMIDNQLGRRNLNSEQFSYYRGLKYLKLKLKKGGYDSVIKKGNTLSTANFLASTFKVSESTIKRDAKFAEALEVVGRSNIDLRNQILSGNTKVTKSDVIMLLSSKDVDRVKVMNEADLYNQARAIESDLLSEIEDRVKSIEHQKLQKSREALVEIEPLFLEREDRIRKIKGLIISAINKAIGDKDMQSIEELKKLIEALQELIFSGE